MQLNEDSLKKVDDVIAKTYYFWINEDDRLTLEVVDIKDKPLQECVGITLDTINKMNSKMLNEMPALERYGNNSKLNRRKYERGHNQRN